MASIIARARKDGTVGYTALIRIKKGGTVIHTETQTFDREQAAKAWVKKRETELAQPGALTKTDDPLLRDAIDKYNTDKLKAHGSTKTQVLRSIQNHAIGAMRCSQVTSQALVQFVTSIDAQPSTRGNYMSHLASIFVVARPAWGYPLDKQAMDDARTVLNKMGLIGKSNQRTRRPSIAELEQLFKYYATAQKQERTPPMVQIILFAIFSTRRQEEICRLEGKDLDAKNLEIVVRDMKNPGEKIGNDVTTTLTPEALALIQKQPATQGAIYPYNHRSVSASFSRACTILGIEDLHFHDLRHDGISRLFEMGLSIPRVACVSGHRSWASLKRYTHIRQEGDKYADWPWLKKFTELPICAI